MKRKERQKELNLYSDVLKIFGILAQSYPHFFISLFFVFLFLFLFLVHSCTHFSLSLITPLLNFPPRCHSPPPKPSRHLASALVQSPRISLPQIADDALPQIADLFQPSPTTTPKATTAVIDIHQSRAPIIITILKTFLPKRIVSSSKLPSQLNPSRSLFHHFRW